MDRSHNSSSDLTEDDVRKIIGLLGDVAVLETDLETKKAHLMNGLCQLIDAHYWVWGLATKLVPHEQPVYTALAAGGFEEDQFSKLIVAFEHPDVSTMTALMAEEIAARRKHLTRLREDYDPDELFENCDATELFEFADVGAPILSFCPVQNECVSAIGVYRKFNSERFTRREAKITHVLLSEIAWLHDQGWPWISARRVPQLPNRCRLVLNLLLEGLSRKQIADEMAISEHTVNGHAKRIYQYFNVHSQPELVSRFRHSDGGDSPITF